MMIGRTLSHYEITGKLGAGGMGEVYLARDLKLDRPVALKVLPAEVAEDPSRLKRLQREAKALATLDHPNIVTVYSVEEDEGTHFLTMAYVEGRTLGELIPESGMPVDQLIDLAAALADALRAAHERGIIHRDLKPANIMVDGSGRLRVLDFGLARVEEAAPVPGDHPTQKMEEPITKQGLVMGTIPYMSPEQAEGKVLDPRSDIFSLGVVLYEMASGSRPFAGDTPASLISSILRDEPSPVSERCPHLPERMREIIERCLAKSLDDRYQSAQLLRDELEALRRELLSGSLSGERRVGGQASHRLRAWTAALAVIGVLLVVGTMVVKSRVERSAPEIRSPGSVTQASSPIRSIAVLPLKNLSGDPEQEYFADGMTEELITNLSKISALRVISRTSAMRYKASDKALKEIAEELGVEGLIEGSIAREGDRVRVTAQLIHAGSDATVWADRYERELSSVMALQGELAKSIAMEVEVSLTPEDETRLGSVRRVDQAAYDSYLKGIFHRNQFTPRDLATALDYFSTALERDPDYAPAYVGAASIWAYRMVLGLVSQQEGCRNWKVAISGGLSRDDMISEAHVGLAQIRMVCDWDWSAADEEYRRAIDVNPGNAEARMFYANFLGSQQRHDEAEEQMRLALELDPMNGFYRAGYGVLLSFQGRFDEAVTEFERSFEISPGGGFAHHPYSRALYRTGRKGEAIEALAVHLTMLGESVAAASLRDGAVRGYEVGAARAAEALAEDSMLRSTRPMILVHLFDDSGNRDAAIKWLEHAFEIRDLDMAYLSVLDLSEELRADPRYKDILDQMQFPVEM